MDWPIDVFQARAALARALEIAVTKTVPNDRLSQVKAEREASLKQRRLSRLGIPPLFIPQE